MDTADRALAMLQGLYSGEPVPAAELGRRLGVTSQAVNRALAGVRDSGLVEAVRQRGWQPVLDTERKVVE
jgi:biotin operon repressor